MSCAKKSPRRRARGRKICTSNIVQYFQNFLGDITVGGDDVAGREHVRAAAPEVRDGAARLADDEQTGCVVPGVEAALGVYITPPFRLT